MPSMTGYGKGTARSEAHGVSLSVELTTLNRKSLDCSYSGPKEWSGLEQRCKEWILPHFSRGRVQIQIKLLHAEAEQSAYTWNFAGVQAQLERLKQLAVATGVPFQADTQLLWDLAQSA
ncbi:MAG: YicC/YloC family endoribonuclease, partial [Opitutales bacterium]